MSTEVPTPPKICMLVETFAPEIGGGETQARLLAEGLLESGCEVVVLTRRSDSALAPAEQLGPIPVVRLPPSGRGQLKKWGLALTTLWPLVRMRKRYDLLLACPFRILGIPAVLASGWLRKPCILKAENNGELSGAFFGPGLERWGLSPSSWVVRPLIAVRNWLLRRATAFVALSSTIAAELRAHRVAADRVHVIPNGVDTARFRPPTPAERAERRRALGITSDEVVFVFTGRLVSYKGLAVLLRAWETIHTQHPTARLFLVGSGSADMHNCEAELRNWVAAHHMERAVTFTGEVRDVVPYLQAADAFVFPTEKEAFGIALIEAMACGLPAITTPIGGIPDIVTPEEDAILVEPGDEAGLQKAIARLLADPTLAARLGRAARSTVTDRYGGDAVVQRYVELFAQQMPPREGAVQ